MLPDTLLLSSNLLPRDVFSMAEHVPGWTADSTSDSRYGPTTCLRSLEDDDVGAQYLRMPSFGSLTEPLAYIALVQETSD